MPDHPHKLRRRFEIAQQLRFLTFSCYQRLPLFNNEKIKDEFVAQLREAQNKHQFLLFAWVIMPEHMHLMLTPNLPHSPVSRILADLKGRFANAVLGRWKELNAPVLNRLRGTDGSLHFWQAGGGYDRNVRDDAEAIEKINYMHNNPQARGLAQNPLDWRYSSARWYSGLRDGELEMDDMNSLGF